MTRTEWRARRDEAKRTRYRGPLPPPACARPEFFPKDQAWRACRRAPIYVVRWGRERPFWGAKRRQPGRLCGPHYRLSRRLGLRLTWAMRDGEITVAG